MNEPTFDVIMEALVKVSSKKVDFCGHVWCNNIDIALQIPSPGTADDVYSTLHKFLSNYEPVPLDNMAGTEADLSVARNEWECMLAGLEAGNRLITNSGYYHTYPATKFDIGITVRPRYSN